MFLFGPFFLSLDFFILCILVFSLSLFLFMVTFCFSCFLFLLLREAKSALCGDAENSVLKASVQEAIKSRICYSSRTLHVFAGTDDWWS